MRRAIPAVAVSVILAGAARSAFADNAQYSAPYGTGGSYNVYEFVRNGSLTWDEARVAAASKSINGVSGTLVTMRNATQNGFLHFLGPNADWWIGLSDSDATSTLDGTHLAGHEAVADRNGGWAWVSGEPYSFQNWGDGEPNDWPGWNPPGEDAVQMRGDGLWNDNAAGPTIGQAGDSPKFNYIIEYRTNSPTRPVDFLPAPAGGMGFFGMREIHKNGGMGQLLDIAESATTTRQASKDVIDYTAPIVNIRDNGGGGHFGDDAPFQAVALGHAIDPDPPGGGGDDDDDVNDIMLLATGKIRVPAGQGGVYTFGVNSDDGFMLTIRGKSFSNAAGQAGTSTEAGLLAFNAGRGADDSLGQVTLEEGDYDIQLQYWEGGGGSAVELFAAKGAKTGFDSDFRLVGQPEKSYRRLAPFVGPNHISVMNFNGTTSLTAALAAVQAFKAGTRAADASGVFNTVNFADPDNAGANRGGTVAYPNNTAGVDDENFATYATGFMTVNQAGKYTFDILADDSAFFRILDSSGNPVALFSTTVNAADSNGDTINDAFHNDGGCCSDIFGTYDLGIGSYTFELVNNEQGGGASTVLYAALGQWTSFGPQFQLLGENIDDTLTVSGGLQLVPEPATLGVLTLLAAAGLIRRRRRD